MTSTRPSSWTDRILSRLAAAESHEPNPHIQSDYRIAWITVSLASRGSPQPDVEASYRVLGLHPTKVWPAIVARREALLGEFYAQFHGVELPPKKSSQSERSVSHGRGKVDAA